MYWLWGEVGKRNRLLSSICLQCQGENLSPNKDYLVHHSCAGCEGLRVEMSGQGLLHGHSEGHCTEVSCFAVTVLKFSIILPLSLILSVRSDGLCSLALVSWPLTSAPNFVLSTWFPGTPAAQPSYPHAHSTAAATLRLQQELGCGCREGQDIWQDMVGSSPYMGWQCHSAFSG